VHFVLLKIIVVNGIRSTTLLSASRDRCRIPIQVMTKASIKRFTLPAVVFFKALFFIESWLKNGTA